MKDADIVGVAVVGLGTVGLRYIEQFVADDRFRVIGGFDLAAAAAEHANEAFGVTVFDSAHALITDPDVDVVYVAVPPVHHGEFVALAVTAGKALLCEKPLGVGDAQSTEMVDLVAGSRAPAAVNFVFGAAPAARDLISATAAASIDSCDLRVHFEAWPRAWQTNATWLRDRDQGGWVREVVSHFLFLSMRMFGPLSIQSAQIGFPADGSAEQSVMATLRAGSTPLRIAGTSDSAGSDEVVFTVRGVSESWRLVNWYGLEHCTRHGAWKPAIDSERAGGPAAYAAQLDNLVAMVSGQPHTLATFEEALAVQRCVEALLAMHNGADA